MNMTVLHHEYKGSCILTFYFVGSEGLLFLHLFSILIRDWSLITGWGATKLENRGSESFCAPPQDRVKLFVPNLLKLFASLRKAKTSSYRIKTNIAVKN